MPYCDCGASVTAPNFITLPSKCKRTCFVLLHKGEGTSDLEASKGAFVDRWPLALAESFKGLTNTGCWDTDLIVRKRD